jgi:hypothetical protein
MLSLYAIYNKVYNRVSDLSNPVVLIQLSNPVVGTHPRCVLIRGPGIYIGLDHILRLGRTLGASLQLDEEMIGQIRNSVIYLIIYSVQR